MLSPVRVSATVPMANLTPCYVKWLGPVLKSDWVAMVVPIPVSIGDARVDLSWLPYGLHCLQKNFSALSALSRWHLLY